MPLTDKCLCVSRMTDVKNGQSQGSRAVDRMKPDLCRQARWVSQVVQQRRDRIQGDTFMFLLSWLRPWEEVKKPEEDLLCREETFLRIWHPPLFCEAFRKLIVRLHSSLGTGLVAAVGYLVCPLKMLPLETFCKLRQTPGLCLLCWGKYSCLFS